MMAPMCMYIYIYAYIYIYIYIVQSIFGNSILGLTKIDVDIRFISLIFFRFMADLKHIYIYFNIKFEFKQKRLRQFKLTFDLG